MKAYIYIDESGAFDEKLTGGVASIVGGICSPLSPIGWQAIHQKHLGEFNAKHSASFAYPDHFHCGPFLSGNIGSAANTPTRDRRNFAESVLNNILNKDNSLFGFASRNRGKRFEYSPQATYVMNLIAALRCAFEHLQLIHSTGVECVTVVVAQRTIAETVKASAGNQYMALLLSFVSNQLLVGEGPGVTLARRLDKVQALEFKWAVGDRDAGLIGADFICCLTRLKAKLPDGATFHQCNPDPDILLGDYERFHMRLANEMLHNGYYGNHLDFSCRTFPLTQGAPELGTLLQRLGSENSPSVLEREVPALLAVVHQLAKNRSEAPNLLSCATIVAEKLVTVAKRQIESSDHGGIRQKWVELQIGALEELAYCYNHIGATGPQKEAENQLIGLLSTHKGNSGLDPLERKTLIMNVQNRNLNLLFNDYRFEEAYTMAGELIEARRDMIGGEDADKLLGEMLGSQGQACAFMGRLDPRWTMDAITLFEESMIHFAHDSRQEEMARNFIVTALWQTGQFRDAASKMTPKAGWRFRADHIVASLDEYLLLPHAEQRAFDVVNGLRILSGLIHQGEDINDLTGSLKTLKPIAQQNGTDHPYEHWWKWLGILHLLNREGKAASECFSNARAICQEQSFTMKTIGLSIVPLQIFALKMLGKEGEAENMLHEYQSTLSVLKKQSIGYDAYMTKISLDDHIEDMILEANPETDSFWVICAHLPFAYA